MLSRDEHCRIRYWILNLLAPSYPNPVDFVLLRKTLDNFGYTVSDRHLCSLVSYLQERGYAVITAHDDYDLRMATITADGLDVLEGRKKDAGVCRV